MSSASRAVLEVQEIQESGHDAKIYEQSLQDQQEELKKTLNKKDLPKPQSTCYGITNLCKDGSRVFFADYDRIDFGRLCRELDSLIKRFPKLFSNFLILESSPSFILDGNTIGSYHVICPVKLSYQKLCEILSFTSIDPLFYRMLTATSFRSNTLRISPKFDVKTGENLKEAPRFICFYPTTEKLNPKGAISSAHLRAYEKLLNVPQYKMIWNQEDQEDWVELNKYDTGGK